MDNDLLLQPLDGQQVKVVECKFIKELINNHGIGSSSDSRKGGGKARDSLWNTARSAAYTTGPAFTQLWLALDASITTQEIRKWVTTNLAKDPRYTVGAERTGTSERLSWDLDVKLPVKLDPVKQEQLRGYI